MKKQVVVSFIIVSVLFLCGCMSYLEQSRNDEARREYEDKSTQVDVDALKERTRILESAQEKLSSELAAMKLQVFGSTAESRAAVARMEQSVKALESASEQAKKEMVENLSKTIEEIMRAPQRRGTGSISGQGSEHVVAAGETLSEIARTYGVSLEALARVNNLSDINNVRSGTKLIIPK